MEITGESTYDGLDTWYNDKIGDLMRRKPWGFVHISRLELDELIGVGLLAQFRHLDDKNLLGYEAVSTVCDKLSEEIKKHGKENMELFCRINECSMKRNIHGSVVPFTSPLMIIRYMLEDHRVYRWLSNNRDIETTRLVLSDFDNTVNIENEYRVFVRNGKVTGISPYRWYRYAVKFTEESAIRFAKNIVYFVEVLVLSALATNKTNNISIFDKEKQTFVIDMISDNIDDVDSLSMIEINKFGGETGCGSALFNWKKDEKELYNETGDVYIRCLVEKPMTSSDEQKSHNTLYNIIPEHSIILNLDK